jgi:hypothetical protein
MLLEALVACAGVTLRAVATSLGLTERYCVVFQSLRTPPEFAVTLSAN